MIFPITSSRWIRAIASMPPKPSARSVVWRIACSTASAVHGGGRRVRPREAPLVGDLSHALGAPRRACAPCRSRDENALRQCPEAGRSGISSTTRAPPAGAASAHDAAAVRRGDRLDDREPEPGAAGVARAGPVEAVEAVEDRVALIDAGCPGPSSSTMNRRRSPPISTPSLTSPSLGGVGDPVAQEVAQGLRKPALVGLDEHFRDRAELEPPRRRRPPCRWTRSVRNGPQLDDRRAAGTPPRRPGRAAACPRRAGSSARPRARTSFSTRRTSAASGSSASARTSSWPRITVSGVRSSCEASATNAVWRSKASWRRSSMWSNASASTRTSSWRSPISIRGPRSPPSTRAATRAIRRSGAATREATAKPPASAARTARAPGEQELVAHRALGAVGGRGRLADAQARDRLARPRAQTRTSSSMRPPSGSSWTLKPGGAARKLARGVVLAVPARAVLSLSSGGASPRSSGSLLTGRPPTGDHEEHVVGRAERLVGEVGAGPRGDRRGSRRAA